MALMSPKYVKKLLVMLLNKHYIAHRFPSYCLYDKKSNPVLKISEKKFDKISVILKEKGRKHTVSKKLILAQHGNSIFKTTYKELRCLSKQPK